MSSLCVGNTLVSVSFLQSERLVLDNFLEWIIYSWVFYYYFLNVKYMPFQKVCQMSGAIRSPKLWKSPYVDFLFEGQLCLCGH